jgi:hypothetical protein
MKLDQVQLLKNITIGGAQRSLLESADFELDADLETRLVAVTHKRTGRRTIITFEGVAAMMPAAVQEPREQKAVKRAG